MQAVYLYSYYAKAICSSNNSYSTLILPPKKTLVLNDVLVPHSVISPIDGKSMESINSTKMFQKSEYKENGKIIRWTEVQMLNFFNFTEKSLRNSSPDMLVWCRCSSCKTDIGPKKEQVTPPNTIGLRNGSPGPFAWHCVHTSNCLKRTGWPNWACVSLLNHKR